MATLELEDAGCQALLELKAAQAEVPKCEDIHVVEMELKERMETVARRWCGIGKNR